MIVRLTPSARRQLLSLPAKVVDVIGAALTGPLQDDPYRCTKPLHMGLDGTRVLRRGDYRVIVTIDDDAGVIVVLRIQHRSDVYRSR